MKEVIRGYKFRIHPTEEQALKIDKTISTCNFVYNRTLTYRQCRYKNFGEKLSKFDLIKLLPRAKIDFVWLKEYDSKALQTSISHMDKAYQNFFKGIAKYPKFKSRKKSKKSYTTKQLRIADGYINLPKIGKVKLTCYNQRFRDWYQESECTVSKSTTGKYYISLLVKENLEQYPKTNGRIGIDLGVKTFATTSNNEQYHLSKSIWKYEKRIGKLQRKLSRQTKDSIQYKKTRLLIAKHYNKIANIRTDFLHKLTTKLVKDNQLIAIEDLNVKGMMKNRRLVRAIGRMGFHTFKSMLLAKANWHDREVVVINRWYPSSKTCSCCGNMKKDLKLSDRIYHCEKCGLEIDRDYNASINILAISIKN